MVYSETNRRTYTHTKSIPKVDQDSKGQKRKTGVIHSKAKAVIHIKMFSLKKGGEKGSHE